MLEALTGIGGLASSVFNSISGAIANEKNLAFQKETLDYQKGMQKEAWAREDSAAQRRVADLKAAGLSPVLAAGSAAATSSPIPVLTPQVNPTRVESPADSILQAIAVKNGLEQIAKTQAEVMRTRAEADLADLTAKFHRKTGTPPTATQGTKEGSELISAFFGEGNPVGTAVANLGSKAMGIIEKLPIGKTVNVFKASPIGKAVAPVLSNVIKQVPKFASKFRR